MKTKTVARPDEPTHPAVVPPFDPFLAVPYLRRLAAWPSASLLIALPLVATLLYAVTTLEGTRGGFSSLQFMHDTRSALGIPHTPASQPQFPLMRDLSSQILILVICLTIGLVHLQWKYMRQIVPSLIASGALIPKHHVEITTAHRVLRHARLLKSTSDTPSTDLLDIANRILARIGRSSGLIVLVSFILALPVAVGPTKNGIFSNLAAGVPAHKRHAWISAAYHSWWASINHPVGFMIYIILIALGIFLVIMQNSVGLLAVWTLLGLSAAADFDLDWLDRDGNLGWASVSLGYRTVILSLIIHGSALSITLLALGLRNFFWAIAMVMVWTIMLPSATLGPLLALRGVSEAAQSRRIEQLLEATGSTEILNAERLRGIIRDIRSTRAHPLRVSRINLSALFVAVLLPIVLTIAQIYFSLK